MKVELDYEEMNHIINLLNSDYEDGKSAIYNNPESTMLKKLWRRNMEIDKSLSLLFSLLIKVEKKK